MLKICDQLFGALNESGIPYCHWKSNEHLVPALEGDTDLDVLISRGHAEETLSLLQSLNFKHFKPVSYLDYNAIEDYLGFDRDTGRLVHLHLHWELVVGRKFVKQVHLPWEDFLYKSRVLDQETSVYRTSPEWELLILLVRSALKNSPRNNRRRIPLASDELIEYRWLKERIDEKQLQEHCRTVFGEKESRDLVQVLTSEKRRDFLRLAREFRKALRVHRIYNRPGEKRQYLLRKVKAAFHVIRHKKLRHPVPYRRSIPRGGMVVAFYGIDGAGKSTILKDIRKWASWKLDVFGIYFGSGDGSSSLLRAPMRFVAKIRQKKKGNVVTQKEKVHSRKRGSAPMRFARSLWALTLAGEKKKKMLQLLKARHRGMLILCDRYPQTVVKGYNDGPLLQDWQSSRSPLKRRIARWEWSVYDLANKFQPDLTVKLDIPVELALERKQDTPAYMIERKKEAIEAIHNGRVEALIDSSRSVEETSLAVRRLIWEQV